MAEGVVVGGEPRLQRKAQKVAPQTGDGRVQGGKGGNWAGQRVTPARAWAGASRELRLHLLSLHGNIPNGNSSRERLKRAR